MSTHLADRKDTFFTLFQHIDHDQVLEIVDHLPDAILLMDNDRIYFPNKAACKLFDRTEITELIGVTLTKILHHFSSSSHTIPSFLNSHVSHAHYHEKTLELCYCPLKIFDQYDILVLRDLDKENKTDWIPIEYITDIITRSGPNGEVHYISPSIKQLLGYDSLDLLRNGLSYVVHPDDLTTIAKEGTEQILLGKKQINLQFRVRNKEGYYMWIESHLFPVLHEDGTLKEVIASSRDISSLIQSNKKYKTLLENSIDTIGLVMDDCWVYINDAGRQLFEVDDVNTLIGKPMFDRFNLEQYTTTLFSQKLTAAELFNKEYIFTSFKGNIRYVKLKAFPISIEGKEAYQVIIRDFTDTKHKEALTIQSEKHSVAGQLAAGIAHEIRNPLTSLKGFLELLRADDSNKREQYIGIMATEMERIEKITSELLLLAKPASDQIDSHNLVSLLRDVKVLLDSQAIINNIDIQIVTDREVLTVACDANQLKQVFINLIKNAIEAIGKNGLITIHAYFKITSDITIRISDNGPGISSSVIHKLGEPFFTTKEDGTGLGLMVSYKIIQDLGGQIMVESYENQGTTFTIKLPLIQ